ncbi:MAG: D-3-phosphoglycerate dehydrogenase [Phycisphaerae bacterium]|jgi:D-3-phosphoglycerate dehydrogenase
MIKILVADPLAEEGMRKFTETPGVQADVKTGLSEEELAKVVSEYDGMIIRSGAKVTAKVLANPGKLRAIARAGVGVDNVDLDAATKAGILVMNTPDGNTLSTAEQTMALMLAMSRHIPKADAHVREGKWERKKFTGTQLSGKTLGVVGFGRIGRAVAERALAFGMNVIAYDPFVSGTTAMEGQVKMAKSLDELLPKADYITLHTVINNDTKGMINAAAIDKMKAGVRIVNCARGPLINEADLAEGLKSGKVAAAAIDVFASEPPKDSPLLAAPNTVLAPHLGASTEEAQLTVTVDAAEILLNYLLQEQIRWPVNVAGLPSQLSDRDKSYLDLARRMGMILASLCGSGIETVSVRTHGESLQSVTKMLAKQILADVLSPHLGARLNLINVEPSAQARGIRLEHTADQSVNAITDTVSARVTTRDGTQEVVGEVFLDGRPRIMAVNGYQMNLVPEGEMLLIFNDDRPGVIGIVGTIFGDYKINIADMMLSRQKNTALMLLKLDGPIPQALLDKLAAQKPAVLKVLPVTLPKL